MLVSILFAAVATAPAPLPPAEPLTVVEVPQDHGPQDAVAVSRTIPVGGATPWHTHPGIEIGHVVSGVTEMRTAEAAVRYAAGATFVIPRGTVHRGVNVGDVPAVIAITYLVDHDAPLSARAEEPR